MDKNKRSHAPYCGMDLDHEGRCGVTDKSYATEIAAQIHFEGWAKGGTKPYLYPLQKLAGGDYVSTFTNLAWHAYRAGHFGEDE